MSSWELWIQGNTVVVRVVVAFLGYAVGHLAMTVWKQRKEVEQSELGRVADKLQDLVEQIQYLFQKQDITVTSIDNLGGRVTTLEKKQEADRAKCNEREKLVIDIKLKQDKCRGAK